MSYMIRELPVSELPRERLMKYGVKSLSNEELLSIIIRTGTKNKSVKDLSIDILNKYSIKEIGSISYNTLASIKGIGRVKAVTLLAAIELGRRSIKRNDSIYRINSSNDVYNYVKYEMEDSLQEKFMVLYLDTRKNILDSKVLFIGTVDSSLITPRDIFREGVKNNASSMILVHNHPALSIEPSMKDVEITKVLINLGKMMGIKVLDHIIIGDNKYYSFLSESSDLFK